MDLERITRALKQSMYLISTNIAEGSAEGGTEGSAEGGFKKASKGTYTFIVEGATHKEYKIEIIEGSSTKLKCNCPDFCIRRNICKHIYFIVIRIGKYKHMPTPEELPEFIDNLRQILYFKAEKTDKICEVITSTEDCCICFETMDDASKALVSCCTCKNKFHNSCINHWLSNSKRTNCPLCRSIWPRTESKIGTELSKFKV